MAIADMFKNVDLTALREDNTQKMNVIRAANPLGFKRLAAEAQLRMAIKELMPEKLAWMAETKPVIELGFIMSTMQKQIFGEVFTMGCSLPYWYISKDGAVCTNLNRDEVHLPDEKFIELWGYMIDQYPGLPPMSLEELQDLFTKKMDLALAAKSEYEANLVLDDEEADI